MSSSTMTSVLPGVSAVLRREHGLCINSRWTPSDRTAKLRVFNPATGQVTAHVVDASACYVGHPVRAVWVNSHVMIDPNMPFGRVKQSGIGARLRCRLARCIRRGEVGLHPSSTHRETGTKP